GFRPHLAAQRRPPALRPLGLEIKWFLAQRLPATDCHTPVILWKNGPGLRGHFCMHSRRLALQSRNICDRLDGPAQEPNNRLPSGITHTKMSHWYRWDWTPLNRAC